MHRKTLWIATVLCFAAFIAPTLLGAPSVGGAFLAAFWLLLALVARTYETGRLFCYTLVVLGCATSSLYYPFLYLNCYWPTLSDGSLKLELRSTMTFVTPILQLIMFAMGTQLRKADFAQIVRQPWGVFVGVAAQFVIMPLLGFAIARATPLDPEVAAGLILVGCVPSGIASNVMNYLAKANVALSVTLTAFGTLLGLAITPVWLKFLVGTSVEINALEVAWGMIKLVVFPILAGTAFRLLLPRANAALEKRLSFLSMLGLLMTILFITAAGRDSLLSVGLALIVACFVHNVLGYLLGYWAATACRLDERSRRTVAIEVGMQNGGLAAALANELGRATTMGLAPAIDSPLMNITGSTLAIWWRRKSLEASSDKETPTASETDKNSQ